MVCCFHYNGICLRNLIWNLIMVNWLTLICDIYICVILTIEYFYDFKKDEQKKHKKTRTSKKVTTNRDGQTVTEEATEVSEPVNPTESK